MTHDEVTRRSWILRLGGATALTGFSGTLVAAEPPLPPGLHSAQLRQLFPLYRSSLLKTLCQLNHSA